MKHKILILFLTLLLTGCSLARPEAVSEASGDRFAGVYMVWSGDDASRNGFHSNPYLSQLGTETLDTGAYGTFSVPREVLIAQHDPDTHDYTFPGLEGYPLFSYLETENGEPYSAVCADLSDCRFHVTDTDEGVTHELEGTLYVAPGSSGIWTAYNVFQREDGTVYLDGSGDSFRGAFSAITQSASRTTTVNGDSSVESTKVTVRMEEVCPLEKLVVTQFAGDNSILLSVEPAETLTEIAAEEGAVWLLIEEHRTDGITRTAYTLPAEGEDPITHPVIRIAEGGIGSAATLTIR